jgi:alkaline phosphatase D
MVGERNYATLEFSGPRKDRSMRIRIHDVNGAVLWEKSISATSL